LGFVAIKTVFENPIHMPVFSLHGLHFFWTRSDHKY